MSSTKGPAKGTRIAGGRYYLVRADGPRRVWVPLTRVDEGLPAFYAALSAALNRPTVPDDAMAQVIAAWQSDVMPRHAPKTQRDERAVCATIAASFVEFRACDVRPPDVADYLQAFRAKPRTHNAHRAMLRELMRYAEERGWREAGSNPVAPIRTQSTPPRTRYITDSELRRIKVAAMTGDDGLRTRSGPMLCALIDMAYLTGQRIGDLLALEWADLGADGVRFTPGKTASSTAASVVIEWTPRLRDVERRLHELRVARRGFAPQVFTTQDGRAYTYWGASTAWRRAVKRAGIRDCHFHDLRAKALTDVEAAHGMQAARRMGTHSTEQQTAEYTRKRAGSRTRATR